MTNEERIEFLQEEIDRIKREIKEKGLEIEFKEYAKQNLDKKKHDLPPPKEVLDIDPERDEKLVSYYFSILSELNTINKIKEGKKRLGKSELSKWENEEYNPGEKYKELFDKAKDNLMKMLAHAPKAAAVIYIIEEIIRNLPFIMVKLDDDI